MSAGLNQYASDILARVIFLPPQPYPNFHNRHPAHTLRHHLPSDDWQRSNPAGAYLQCQCSASDGVTAPWVVTNAPPEPFLAIDFACRIHMGRTLLILVFDARDGQLASGMGRVGRDQAGSFEELHVDKDRKRHWAGSRGRGRCYVMGPRKGE